MPVNLEYLIPIFHELRRAPVRIPDHPTLGDPECLFGLSVAIDHHKGYRAQLFFEACKLGRLVLVCLFIQAYPDSCAKLAARGLYFASLSYSLNKGSPFSECAAICDLTHMTMELLVGHYPSLLDQIMADGDYGTAEDVIEYLGIIERRKCIDR